MWDRFLTAFAAVSVMIAGVGLWRLFAVRGVRWFVVMVTTCGAGGFLYAALTGMNIREALMGPKMLEVFSYALQWACIGGLVMLSLAWIATVIRLCVPRFREGSKQSIWYQTVALTSCLAIILASWAVTDFGGDASPKARVALLDKSLRGLADGEREMTRDTWDPDYVVEKVGRTPDALFRWVRDNTYWIPYRGALRGPVGVLMDRQGNSLDRAVLLATLLERAGCAVRLARGELAHDQAIAMLPRLEALRVAAFAPQTPDPAAQSDIHAASVNHRMDGIDVNEDLQSERKLLSHTVSELRARVSDQTDRLLKLIKPPNSAQSWARQFDGAVTALSDHWWVQLKYGQNWLDLDVMAGKLGAALTTASQTSTMKDLPVDLHHTITIRIIAEQWSSGTLNEHKTFETVLRPSDLYGHSVMLQFWPGGWLESDNLSSRHSRAGALAQDKWYALLAIDRNPIAVGLLPEDGDDPNADAPVKGGAFGGIASALARGIGLNQKGDERQLSAVWIEYEIHVPGERARVIRRNVFDLLGASARGAPSPRLVLDDSKRLTRSLALTMKTEILPISCALSPQFVTALVARNLLTDRDLLAFFIGGDLPPGTADMEHLYDRSDPPLSPLYGLALARLEPNQQTQVFIDRPNILTRHLYAAPAGNGIALLDAIDIVANEVGVGLTSPDPFSARVAQGVLDTNAESVFRPGESASLNTGDAFAERGSWTAIASEENAAALTKLSLPDDLRRHIENDLQGGYSVVAPDTVVRTHDVEYGGWWRIDGTTGDVLGLGANGWGAVMPERAGKESWYTPVYRIFKVKIATFAVAFASNYGWCVTPLVVKKIEEYGNSDHSLHHNLGIWEGAIKPSFGACTGDSAFIAGVTAWLLPVGVVGEGDNPKGPAGGFDPPKGTPDGPPAGSGGNGGKGGGKPPSGGAPEMPNDSNPNPPKNDPCADTQPGEPPPPEDPGQGPQAPQNLQQIAKQLAQQVWATEQVAVDANNQYLMALQKWIRYQASYIPIYNAEGDVVGYGAPRTDLDVYNYNAQGDPVSAEGATFDTNVLQQLENAASQKLSISLEASSQARQAQRAWDQFTHQHANQGAGVLCGGAGSGSGSGDPSPVGSLDPALYNAAQSGNTIPGLGPAAPAPGVQIPGDSSDPFAATLPGVNAVANNQPMNPSGQGPAPGSPPPQSWDGKLCPYCSTMLPTFPDSSSDPKPPSSPQTPNSNAIPSKIITGLAGATSAVGGSK